MSIERVYYCDWRDCDNNVRTARPRPDSGLIYVTDHPGPTLHFCSWDCVLKHAAEKPPVEFFPVSAA